MHARTRCAVLVLSGLLVVAACNDDDDDGDGAAIASSDTAGAAAVAEAVETSAPSVDGTERPVDTFGPPVTTIAPSGAVLFGRRRLLCRSGAAARRGAGNTAALRADRGVRGMVQLR